MTVAAPWWSPVTWLQNVAGFFHGAYDAGGAVLNALGSVLTILTQFFRFFFDTGHFIADMVNWITSALFPAELQTWFLGTISTPSQSWDATHIYESLYRGMVAPALMIAAVAAAARIIKALVDHRTPAMQTVLSVLPRFLVAVALIGVPGTSVSLGYTAIVWAVNASISIAGAVVGLILHASLLNGMPAGGGWLTHVFAVLAGASHNMVAVVVGGIPLLILVIYAAFLMIVRTVMLGFCVVMAPFCLATVVFDANNRFFHWWLDLFGSVLLTPLLLGIAIALSLTLASHVVSALVVGPLIAMVTLCGGLWFAAKLIHQLTWRGFNHGSALAGFAAGVATMAAPVHRLSSVGFVAEALGANRDGSNGAVNFMKRMGLAVQGLNPASHGGGGFGTANRRPAGPSSAARDVVAAGGPPDVASVLGVDGRAAVEGSEMVFSQEAFNAFAASHGRFIGSVTRDHAHGSISAGDRAKVAWSRSSPQSQAAFADEFLSTWLGSGTGRAAPAVPTWTPGADATLPEVALA